MREAARAPCAPCVAGESGEAQRAALPVAVVSCSRRLVWLA